MKTNWLFDNFPFISSDKITLCKIQPTDAKELIELLNEPDNSKFNPPHQLYDNYSISDFYRTIDAAFANKKYISLGIYRNNNLNELLGTIQIRNIDLQTEAVEIGFKIRRKHRCKGIATMATTTALKFLFERVEVNRIQATATPDNLACEKVLLNSGFVKEGTIREGIYWDGIGVVSLSFYSILKSEYGVVRGSGMITRDADLSIVKMTGAHYEIMAKWLSDENVLKYYDGRDNSSGLAKVISTYQPMVSGESSVTPCILRENDSDIGFIQFYPITEEKAELKVVRFDNPYGIDLFIGEGYARGRGLGPRIIKLISNYLFSRKNADVIVADPQLWNERSINTFSKCGFKQVTVLPEHELHEGRMETNVIMHRTRE